MQMTLGKTICSYCKIFLTIFLGIFLSETSEELRLGENAFKLEFFCYEVHFYSLGTFIQKHHVYLTACPSIVNYATKEVINSDVCFPTG